MSLVNMCDWVYAGVFKPELAPVEVTRSDGTVSSVTEDEPYLRYRGAV